MGKLKYIVDGFDTQVYNSSHNKTNNPVRSRNNKQYSYCAVLF